VAGSSADNSKWRLRLGEGGPVNPSTAFAAVLADELARCGLREVVVAPGSRSTPLAMAFWELERAGRVRLHVRIDERSASFTALGLAKGSGRPVAVLCTSGTAAANFHPAVIEADESAVPLLVLTADRPPELRGTGASQTIDQVKLYGSAVRWYAEAGVPERRPGMAGYWRSLACRAWAHAAGALGTLPGPVHLNLPFRDPLVPDDGSGPEASPGASTAPTYQASPGTPAAVPETDPGLASRAIPVSGAVALPAAAPASAAAATPAAAPAAPDIARPGAVDWPESLAGRSDGGPWTRIAAGAAVIEPLELPWAERGVVVCGDGDYDAAALVALAERAGWPVLAEPSSGARRGPNALTGYQYLLASPRFMAAYRPQVIISAGRPGLTRPQSALLGLARAAGSTSVAEPAGSAESAGSAGGGGPAGPVGSAGAATSSAGAGGSASAAIRHVVVASGPGLWADTQRAATDVVAAIRLTGVPGDPGAVVPGRWLKGWLRADAAATGAASAVLDAWGAPRGGALSEPDVARELVAALPENAVLWCGNSLSVRDIDLLMPPRADTRVIASRGASGIDGTFSTAAGAALAHAAEHPGAVAFALIGDLSLLHDAPGLAIGPAEPRPDLCLVVVNNDGGGIFEGLEPARFKGDSARPEGGAVRIEEHPARFGEGNLGFREGTVRHGGGIPGGEPVGGPSVFERVFGTAHGVSIEQLAAAFGVPYTLVERPGDIAKAVASAAAGTGPRIVEARTGRAANAGLRARMRAAAVAAADGAAAPPDRSAPAGL
jgi:2-succinyl-5-enolpyruvyl-6-hydroxy-3-cyclohexene-1-carboxylate synthase